MAPEAHRFECLVTREWNYLKELEGMALLEEVCHSGQALRFQKPKPNPVLLSLPAAYSSYGELAATFPAPGLPTHCHAFCHDNNVLNL